MISDRSDFRVQSRRLFVIMIRTSYRWICNHPFLLGFIGFLYFLHSTCPLLFASLVSASPVLVCTFVLLGTILSFGEPNIPEIEKEPEIVHEAAPFRTEVSRDATVVERSDKSFTVETFVNTEKDDGNGDADRLRENQLSEVEEDGRPFDYRPLVDETLDENKQDTHVRFEEKAFFFDLGKSREITEENLMENGERQVSDAEQSRKIGGSLNEMMDDLSPISPWRPMRHEEDEDDDADRDDSMDSGSDGAESSSPDASMTDIIPMLDELHPLLHSETPSRGIADGEGSDAASEGPHRSSSDEGMESDVDSESSESHGEEGDNENEEEDEDEEEEEEKKEEKEEDESKSAIKWTEADQKNVMDLGSLELERNLRLENLIARRRARHNMRVMAERNLIDLDSADIPFNMPPISTARHNPFDLPYDSYDDMAIPGSAPSIMFARRNPFDIPYEPNEEKPDLKSDGFDEEFSSHQPKDSMFRRHESFSVGPSTLGGPRHDRLRPFFVLERLANEGTSYYPFERQLSEVSESKVSSVPDTESVCTILEDDEKKVDEHDADRETEIAKVDTADEEKSHSASDHDEEKSHSTSDHDEEKSHTSEDSDFDEQGDSRNLHHDVAEIILGSAETSHEESTIMEGETSDKGKLDEEDSSDSDSSLSEIEEKTPDISERETMLISEQKADLHEESGISSQPSFGELEIHAAQEPEDDYHNDDPPADGAFITAYPSLEESAINELCGLVNDHHHKEPVYDSSPSASRFPSFSSVSSDYKPDLPVKNEEEVQENADKEHEVYFESIGPTEIHSTSDETESRTREVGEASGEASHFIAEVGVDSPKNPTVSGSEIEDALLDPSSMPLDKSENANHHLNYSSSVSSQEDMEEEVKEDGDTRALDVSASLVSPSEKEVVSSGVVEQELPIEPTSSPLGYGDTREHVTASEDSPDVVHDIAESSSVAEEIMQEEEVAMIQADEATPQTFNEDIPFDSYSTLSSGAVEYVETHSFNDEDAPQSEQDPIQSSISDARQETHPHPNQTMDIEVDSINASGQNVGSEETTPSESDRELTWADKSVVEQSPLEPGEDPETSRAGPVSVVFSRNITFHEYHDAPEDSTELSCLTSDTSSTPTESPEFKTPMIGEGSSENFFQEAVYEEIDNVAEQLDELTDLHAISTSPPEIITEDAAEIKEIDEGLLSELDTIGDFSVKEVVMDFEPGSSSVGLDYANEQTEALPVLEARSVEDIESAFQQINEGSEVEDVILPSTVQDQLAQENETDTVSDLVVVEATSMEDLDNVMKEAVVESMRTQPNSPESKGAVETEPSMSLVEERSLDVTNVPLINTPEKEEEEETKPKEITSEDISPIETQPLEKLSESKETMAMEVISEKVGLPTETIESSSDVVVTEEEKAEAKVESHESKETLDNLVEGIAEQKRKEGEEAIEVVTEEVKAETASNAEASVPIPESKETLDNSVEVIAEQKKKEGGEEEG